MNMMGNLAGFVSPFLGGVILQHSSHWSFLVFGLRVLPEGWSRFLHETNGWNLYLYTFVISYILARVLLAAAGFAAHAGGGGVARVKEHVRVTIGQMPEWLDRLLRRPARPQLRGMPALRRMKNYSALSGYAYEYFYEGYRDAGGRREYEFTVSGDRKTWFPLRVGVRSDAAEMWEKEHHRRLDDRERYALAKLALFSAFDERPNPQAAQAPIEVTAELAASLLERLEL